MRLRMSRRIHGEDFESGRRHARYVHVLFHRNVPRGIEGMYMYIKYLRLTSQDPPRIHPRSCVWSSVPPRIITNDFARSYVNLQISRESRIPPISIAKKTLALARGKTLDFYIFTTHEKMYIKKGETNGFN